MQKCTHCGMSFPSAEFVHGRTRCRSCLASLAKYCTYRRARERRYAATPPGPDDRQCPVCHEYYPPGADHWLVSRNRAHDGWWPVCRTCTERRHHTRELERLDEGIRAPDETARHLAYMAAARGYTERRRGRI